MSEKVEDLDVRFERFYAANYPRVKNFAKLLTKSEEDAEDIAQNIFLKLWTRPELWQEQETMTSYLYTVTRNEIFNLFKHQKVEQEYEDKIMKAQLIGDCVMKILHCSKISIIKKCSSSSRWHSTNCLPNAGKYLR